MPLSEANRSRSEPMYSSTWSGVTSASSTVTGMPSMSGRSNFGRTSTSAVNASSLPSSSLVISTVRLAEREDVVLLEGLAV